MSWINDLCKSIKSKCWCWCQCICCPNGNVQTDNDEPCDIPSESSSRIETKIRQFYNSLPNTPIDEKKSYFISTSSQPVNLNQTDHNHVEKPDNRPVHLSK